MGRQQEIETVRGLLQHGRLVTLTGAGGVGKSRLALEIVRTWATQTRGGTWLVELAVVADAQLMLPTLAGALGIREQPGQPLLDTVTGVLRGQAKLLLLDNCEHLTEACAQFVTALLRACPDLRVLATSRHPLDTPDEQVLRLPSLSLPSPTDSRIETVLEAEAARLFAERGQAAFRALHLTDRQAPAVAEICRRLDGIPLALELAAALLPAFTPEQLAQQLDDRFQLLTMGNRGALPRHQTLRALVDWSYGLLTEREQLLLRRLAVFAGGWTLEVAERVVADGGMHADPAAAHGSVSSRVSSRATLTASEVRALMRRLVRASLVVVDRTPQGTRFSFLETIRAYALEKLTATDEGPQLRHRHLAWLVDLAHDAQTQLWSREQRACIERFETELPNVRAALAWSLESGNIQDGLRVLTGSWRFWEQRGHVGEARTWLTSFLAHADIGVDAPGILARTMACYLAYLQGDAPAALAYGNDLLPLARELGDPYVLMTALLASAILAMLGGDAALNGVYLREVVEISRSGGPAFGARVALANLGEVSRICGDLEGAVPPLHEALALAEAAGDEYSMAYTVTSLAHIAYVQGRLAEATRLYEQTLSLWLSIGDIHNVPHAIEGLGWVAAADGRVSQAACLLGAASELRAAQGASLLPHWRADRERSEEVARRALGDAAFATAWKRGAAMSVERAIAFALGRGAEPGALTRREHEIAALVGEGHGNREIATRLGLSERTVEWHVSNILNKRGLRSRAQLTAHAAHLEQAAISDGGLAANAADMQRTAGRSDRTS